VVTAKGKFMNKGNDMDLTCLGSGKSFLQVKVSMTMQEKLHQVGSATCGNR
jgi:hypothetical protein